MSKKLLRRWLCAALLVALSSPAWTQARTRPEIMGRVRDRVGDLAFDPNRYFVSEYGDEQIIEEIITIAYTGDDYAWPVYSIAIADGCLEGEENGPACGARLTARMVRAPAPPDMTRPRHRGAYLVHQLVERRATSRAAIRAQLSGLGVEWLEADLRQCPGIGPILARSQQLSWVPEEVSDPRPRDVINIVLHADLVEVVFESYARRSTYRGYIADGSPADWAVELAGALEPCWRPAMLPPPWSRSSTP